jgi:hypothetical protein
MRSVIRCPDARRASWISQLGANVTEAAMDPLIDQVIEQLRTLPRDLQMRVYEFTRSLVASYPRGTAGRQLLRFAGTVPPDELQLMREAIEEGCERIDANEW